MKKSEIYRAALVALRGENVSKMEQDIWLEVILQLCEDWRNAQWIEQKQREQQEEA